MKKMKQIAAAGLVLSMMLTACGGSKTGETSAAAQTNAAANAAQSDAAESAASGNAQNNQAAEEITIWYEGGDARLPFFKAVEAEMQKDYPNYTINAVTFDNSTFMTKVLQAASATGGVDLVFIDEGFGSLDEEARGRAICILNELAGNTRLVGIISHVTELKEQMDRKLVIHTMEIEAA